DGQVEQPRPEPGFVRARLLAVLDRPSKLTRLLGQARNVLRLASVSRSIRHVARSLLVFEINGKAASPPAAQEEWYGASPRRFLAVLAGRSAILAGLRRSPLRPHGHGPPPSPVSKRPAPASAASTGVCSPPPRRTPPPLRAKLRR